MWWATADRVRVPHFKNHFNPRPPCGGRHPADRVLAGLCQFQSTPPVWGATVGNYIVTAEVGLFQSTPPVWGATLSVHIVPMGLRISIHAPRVGGDGGHAHMPSQHSDFNPRPPCGGRPLIIRYVSCSFQFQSTPPVWGATIHVSVNGDPRFDFNPRPPCGGRQQKQLKIQAVLVKNRQFLQISSSNSYPILKNKVASLQIILQNLVRDLGDFLRAYVSHLKHQYIFWVVGCLYSKMLDLVFIAVSQVIKTKTVLFRVHDLTQLCL